MTNREAIEAIKALIGHIEWEYPIDYSEALDIAIKALAEDNNIPCSGWISVKDRLPDKSGEYLVFSKVGYHSILQYSTRHKAFNALDDEENPIYRVDVTHWMPLPAQPTEEQREAVKWNG